MIDYTSLVYSLDPEIKRSKLRSWSFDSNAYALEPLQQWMVQHNIQSSRVWDNAHYKFSSIVSKPYVIYHQWDNLLLDRPMIAIVWPRKPSSYHTQVMQDFFTVLRWYDVVTISGWAPGIDTQCHELSLQNSIPTVMVLWWWFGYYLRSTKRHLLQKVTDAGWLILSEFRLKEKPNKRTFPQRNRIVAGLAETVFLPGAAIWSGSLITVDFALQMHKPVGTVSANIYETSSAGTNEYISHNKISSIIDFEIFLDTYFTRLWHKAQDENLDLSETEKSIVVSLREHGWLSTDRLSLYLWIPPGNLLVQMMELELKWAVWEKDVGVRSTK